MKKYHNFKKIILQRNKIMLSNRIQIKLKLKILKIYKHT